MKKLIIIMTIAIFLVGCGGQSYEGFYDPYKGTSGLKIEILDNAPPRDIYEDEEIPIGIKLKNDGAYDIIRGMLSITVEKDYMGEPLKLNQDKNFLLKGRSSTNSEGEEDVKMYYSKTRLLDSMSQIHYSDILIAACYEYQTQLKANVCIDPDIFGLNRGEKPCEVKTQTFSGQGAPVAITKIDETITKHPEKINSIIPVFEISVKNSGDGIVLDPTEVYSFCGSETISNDYFNKVYIKAKVGENSLNCLPNPLTLDVSGKGKFRCRVDDGFVETSTSYKTLLSANLRYGYSSTTSTQVVIHKKEW